MNWVLLLPDDKCYLIALVWAEAEGRAARLFGYSRRSPTAVRAL